jgi:GDP-4-dehydro-6-deoxy-D-mannose reductase
VRPILVTGAAGFAGSHLLEFLMTAGAEIMALHRPGNHLPELDRPDQPDSRVTWRAADILDRAAVRAAVAETKPSEIYHLAAAAHVGDSWGHVAATFEVNVRGTEFLLDAVRTLAPEARIFIPGSALIYRPAETALDEDAPIGPASPYGVSKLAQEMLGRRAVTDDGLQVVVTRSFNHVGPRQAASFSTSSFARQIALIEAGLAPPILFVGNLQARRDLTDVRDTVRAYTVVMKRGEPGRPYNVCSGQAYAIADLLDQLVALARVEVTIRIDPDRLRPNDVPTVLGDPTRCARELAWRPEIPLNRTLEDLLNYWRSVVTRHGTPSAGQSAR